jgi:hypothetical protein
MNHDVIRPDRDRYQRAHSGRVRAAADWVSVAEAAREADPQAR